MINDLHSIATNLDGVALAEIAKQLAYLSQGIWCLVGVEAIRLLFQVIGLFLTLKRRAEPAKQAEDDESVPPLDW